MVLPSPGGSTDLIARAHPKLQDKVEAALHRGQQGRCHGHHRREVLWCARQRTGIPLLVTSLGPAGDCPHLLAQVPTTLKGF